jgi:hypothetical protein
MLGGQDEAPPSVVAQAGFTFSAPDDQRGNQALVFNRSNHRQISSSVSTPCAAYSEFSKGSRARQHRQKRNFANLPGE